MTRFLASIGDCFEHILDYSPPVEMVRNRPELVRFCCVVSSTSTCPSRLMTMCSRGSLTPPENSWRTTVGTGRVGGRGCPAQRHDARGTWPYLITLAAHV